MLQWLPAAFSSIRLAFKEQRGQIAICHLKCATTAGTISKLKQSYKVDLKRTWEQYKAVIGTQ